MLVNEKLDLMSLGKWLGRFGLQCLLWICLCINQVMAQNKRLAAVRSDQGMTCG